MEKKGYHVKLIHVFFSHLFESVVDKDQNSSQEGTYLLKESFVEISQIS